ncbi:MAG: NAD(P)-dependent oxidoreductase [Planctomycetota bacterium]|nr:MAG: NAD(P)-dependent oxidoreductase [Planctomycetota bacterium]
MRVLVTGAAGMLGFALHDSCPSDIEWVGSDVAADSPRARHALDITDAAAVAALLDAEGIEAVVNAAAYTNVDGCEEHEADALAVNGQGAGNLARACAERNLPLIHVSTDYVFDGKIPAPGCYAEGDTVGPLSGYGRTKLAGEEQVLAAGGRAWIARTQWLYGLHGGNFVETMLRLAGERDELTVVNDQVGSPTSTHDLAPLLWALLQEQPAPGVYHAVNSGDCSWFDFACEIFSQAQAEVRVAPMDSSQLNRPAPRPARSVLNTAKLQAALGREIPHWRDALSRYLARRTAPGATS